ncbi:component of SufBCD complex [Jannaschia sp. W003]|uniref:component of SufBCD complex n=1 Tax=Jannaschia sp. W003 TaxID=2867012 RepID=UPI0021A3FC08|nr:component of SufBCD complex [Jannaschia sp. W003]UWQ21191.1 component of SufBCD complex [Jannaschia sp. W003]
MDFFFIETAFEVIDMRSFSNLWFWIALAVMWSTASYWVVGVPLDLVRRAAKGDRAALADAHQLGTIHARRLIHVAAVSGLLMTGFTFFVLTALALLGFLYRVEFAQAVFLLLLPMSLVGWLNLRTARRVATVPPPLLPGLMLGHRRVVQGIGVVSIFVTSMWGMWTNVNANVLGG